LISEKKLSSIVGNLDQILFINQELLEGIKTRMGIWEKQDCIGDTMKKLVCFTFSLHLSLPPPSLPQLNVSFAVAVLAIVQSILFRIS